MQTFFYMQFLCLTKKIQCQQDLINLGSQSDVNNWSKEHHKSIYLLVVKIHFPVQGIKCGNLLYILNIQSHLVSHTKLFYIHCCTDLFVQSSQFIINQSNILVVLKSSSCVQPVMRHMWNSCNSCWRFI